ncbi:hypothetical protein HDU98_010068 [Podochytrium sp. JEL0797]|nr:hypothetical protein HDU98_010068 [Podochytrium sp. JEL0797]
MNSDQRESSAHSQASPHTAQWDQHGLQTTPTVLAAHTWSSPRAAAPLATDPNWSTSETDWSSRSPAATHALNKKDSWRINNSNSPSTASTPSPIPTTTTTASGWGPPPATPVANGWGPTPGAAATAGAQPGPSPVSNSNWGANPPAGGGGGGSWAPSFPSGSRRSSLADAPPSASQNTSFGPGIQRRASDVNVNNNRPGSGWGSQPGILSPSTPASSGGWGAIPGVATAQNASAAAAPNWGALVGSTTTSPPAPKLQQQPAPPPTSSGGWNSVPGVSSASTLASNRNIGSGLSAPYSPGSPSVPAPTSGWNAAPRSMNPPSSNDNWGAIPGVSTAAAAGQTSAPAPTHASNWSTTSVSLAQEFQPRQQPTAAGWDSPSRAPQSNDPTPGWGTPPAASTDTSSGWNAPVAAASVTARPSTQSLHTGGWGAPPSAAAVSQRPSLQSMNASTAPAAAGGWGPAPSIPGTQNPASWNTSSAPSSGNWIKDDTATSSRMVEPAEGAIGSGGWGSNTPATAVPQQTGWNASTASTQDARPSVGGWSHPSPVGSQSASSLGLTGGSGNGWGSGAPAPPTAQASGWSSPAAASSLQGGSPARRESAGSVAVQPQGGWGSVPNTVPGTGSGATGWSSGGVVPPNRPVKGVGGIGGWNSSFGNPQQQQQQQQSAPRGPPANGMGGWGVGGVTAESDVGVIGGGFPRRAKSTVEMSNRAGAAGRVSSVGENTLVVSEVGAAGSSMRLFTKSFADIGAEAARQKAVSPKDEFADAIGVFVFGLPASFKIKEILALFGEFGDIMNVGITPKSAKNPSAFAKVEFEVTGSASKAIRATHGKSISASSPDRLQVLPDFGTGVPAPSSSPTAGAPVTTSTPPSPLRAPVSQNISTPGRVSSSVAVPQSPISIVGAAAASASASAGAKLQTQAPVAVSADANAENRTLHIGNCPMSVEKADIERILGRGAEIRFINIVPRPKEKRTMVFVTFKTHAACLRAMGAIKMGTFFGMTEGLKVDFSKAETRSLAAAGTTTATTNSVVSSVSGASGAGGMVVTRKAVVGEKKSTASLNGSIGSSSSATTTTTTATKKNLCPSLYLRDIKPTETESTLRATLTRAGGPVSSCHIIPRLDGTRYAIVTFERGEDAARVFRDKVESAVYPRQRRLTVTNVPVGTTAGELAGAFRGCGEVKRVDFLAGDGGGGVAEIEFGRGEGAILAHVWVVEGRVPGFAGVDGGYSVSGGGAGGGDGGLFAAQTDADETADANRVGEHVEE